MEFEKELLDKLLPKYEKPEDLIGDNGLLRRLTKALMERALEAEMATHLGYQKHDPGENRARTAAMEKAKRRLKRGFRRDRDRHAARPGCHV